MRKFEITSLAIVCKLCSLYVVLLFLLVGCLNDANSPNNSDSDVPVIEGWNGFKKPDSLWDYCQFSANIIVCGDGYAKADSLGVWHEFEAKSYYGTIAWSGNDTSLTLLSLAKPYAYGLDDTIEFVEKQWSNSRQTWIYRSIKLPIMLTSLLGRRRAHSNSFAYINGTLTLIRVDWFNSSWRPFVETFSLRDSIWETIDTITLPRGSVDLDGLYPNLLNTSIINGESFFCFTAEDGGDLNCNVNNKYWVASPEYYPSKGRFLAFKNVGVGNFIYSGIQSLLWNPVSNKRVSIEFPHYAIANFDGSFYVVDTTKKELMSINSNGDWKNVGAADKLLSLRGFFYTYVSDKHVIAVSTNGPRYIYSYKNVKN